jgi:hypothetical protein
LLSRFGWSLPFDARVKLADRWGYALEWGNYALAASVARALSDPTSDEAKVMALAAARPDKYQLAVIRNRDMPGVTADIWMRDERG